MSKKKLYYITTEDDYAEGVFNDKGELIIEIDIYHGETCNEKLLDKLGYEIEEIFINDLLEKDHDDTTATDIFPNLEETIIKLKERIAQGT